ncbi:hypothetical protein BdWA1_001733 [Babesia duncani]|uniref:Uncharacterized protein n=1 Tax=Babesia duncani TaxID=323732 RepID=A0AAD9PKF5_9APIC|nr:hypothetical protein BdWA1_001733 [Babesia duncani]
MTELMHIVDKLRDAAAHAKKECDSKIDATVTKISQRFLSARETQLELHQQLMQKEEKKQTQWKQGVEDSAKEFEKIRKNVVMLVETHKQNQKEFERKMAAIYTQYQKQRSKQDKIDSEEWSQLNQRLKSKLLQVTTLVIA